MQNMKILMVCLGNICRSPLAEGILQSKVDEKGLDWEIDSAGTSGWHIGDPPDPRSVEIALKKGLDIRHQRARKFRSADIDYFNWIYVMDEQNLRDVWQYCQTEAERERVRRLMSLVPNPTSLNVPDPYFGEFGFDLVYNMLDEACEKIIENAERGE